MCTAERAGEAAIDWRSSAAARDTGWLRQIDAGAACADEVMRWGADPLWDTLVPVSVSMLREAMATAPATRPERGQQRPAQDMVGTTMLVVGGDRAITRVRLLGDVVSVKERDKYFEFTVDDATGLLPCVWWKADVGRVGSAVQALQLGRLLHVGGQIRRYKGTVQLNVWFLAPEPHVDGMSLFWLQVPPFIPVAPVGARTRSRRPTPVRR